MARPHVLVYILRVNYLKQALLLALVVTSVLLGLVPIHLTRLILDQVIAHADTSLLAALAGAMLAAVVARALVDYWQTIVSEQLRQMVIGKVRFDLFAHILRMAPDFFSRRSVGQIVTRVQTDTGRLGMNVSEIFTKPIVETATLVIFTAYLMSMNWLLTLLALGSLVVVVVLVPSINRRLAQCNREFSGRMAAYSSVLQESLSASFEIQVHGTYAYEERRVGRRERELSDNFVTIVGHTASLTLLSDLTRGIGPVLVYGYGALLVIRGQLGVGEIVAFGGALGSLYTAVDRLIKYPPLLRNIQDRFEELWEYFDLPQSFVEATEKAPDPAEMGSKLSLARVSFAYESGQIAVQNVSLDIRAGEHVAFVGRSGCGKSTVMSLAGGRLQAHSGEVRLDEQSLAQLGASTVAERVGFVSQAPFLFAGTIRDNLLYALLRSSDGDPEQPLSFLDPKFLQRVQGQSATALDQLLLESCREVAFDEDLLELGLKARIEAGRASALLPLRRQIAERLQGDPAMEPIDPQHYLTHGRVLENLLFSPQAGERPAPERLALWIKTARHAELSLGDLLVAIGAEDTLRDLDYLQRIAAETPELLAQTGHDREELEERSRLAERIKGKALSLAELGEANYQALAGRGLMARESDPERRERLVGARGKFLEALGQQAPEPYRAGVWHGSLSVRENLLFGQTDPANVTATRRLNTAIREVVEEAGLADLVRSWGLDFEVGERGCRLSGGQRQKISIARVLLKAPRLLLLDEITASLDQNSARRIHDLLSQRYRDRTLLAITHQLGWLDQYDRVVMFERGQIVEEGSLARLLENNGAFRQLYEAAGAGAEER